MNSNPVSPGPLPLSPLSHPTTTGQRSVVESKNSESGTAISKEKPVICSHKRWTLGILADKVTDQVPGTVLLLSKYTTKNIPLGLQHEDPRGRSSTRGSITGESTRRQSLSSKKKTPDGQIILDPQPDDSLNDPLNWPSWRRDAALLSLGFYCMLGGGMTPILAAGFNQVADSLNVSYADVARTTGLYMMGLGIGCVIFSPTAILFGKRPVYLSSALLFVLCSVWCALSPNYASLLTARVFQGIAISPVECLPSATIAEIFFLHERAFRVGIYGLLLLGGKNLVPLLSAAIIDALDWRWVFWIVAMIAGFCGILLFLFTPESYWDRTPRPKALSRDVASFSNPRRFSRAYFTTPRQLSHAPSAYSTSRKSQLFSVVPDGFSARPHPEGVRGEGTGMNGADPEKLKPLRLTDLPRVPLPTFGMTLPAVRFAENDPTLPTLHNLNSPYYVSLEKNEDYMDFHYGQHQTDHTHQATGNAEPATTIIAQPAGDLENTSAEPSPKEPLSPQVPSPVRTTPREGRLSYTTELRRQPPQAWKDCLKVWNGRLYKGKWWRAAIRPAILYAYPAVLWSALVYSLSIGWLIVLSESVSKVYSNGLYYNFTPLQVGLVYMSPFIGGVLGTAVAGRLSDIVVRFMARRNEGVYEPEYRLVMAIPVAISTAIGLMGFGWSAEEHDAWIVPTVFFGVISFGCSLGSTTSITFCVDSYRQYAGEALVTLNFSKNIFHGLIWSLFFPQWLEADGSKKVFIAIGCIQLACMLLTVPMYIFGKRARMWTVRKGMMEGF